MLVSVSILSCDNRLECINELNHTKCNYIHVDVMDGKFVSDIQFPLNEIKAIDYVSNKKLDVHLMVDNPSYYLNKIKDFKIEYVTFHIECGKDIERIINKIHLLGFKAGLSVKPGTDMKEIEKYLPKLDMVLVMSVEPGKGGQEFMMETIDRVNYLKDIIVRNKYDTVIEVDGGINNETIKLIPNIDIAVVGSYITKGNNRYEYQKFINKIIK